MGGDCEPSSSANGFEHPFRPDGSGSAESAATLWTSRSMAMVWASRSTPVLPTL